MLDQVYADRLRQTLQDIKDYPEHWNQRKWHCGTSHCFAGFAELRLMMDNQKETFDEVIKIKESDYETFLYNSDEVLETYLGITPEAWSYIIAPNNTLKELESIVKNVIRNDGEYYEEEYDDSNNTSCSEDD